MITKTLLITGVSSNGIGLETCKRILHVQKVARVPIAWKIILAQRNPESPQALAARNCLLSIANDLNCSIDTYRCDLADFSSVRQFAVEILNIHQSLDVVILNAATIVNTYTETIDSNETVYQVNHLSHFLLLGLLEDIVQERVIFVSSSLHKRANSNLAVERNRSQTDFNGMNQYKQSKLLDACCLKLWHRVFQKRNVKVILASPGFVPSTNLCRDNSPLARLAMGWVIHYLPFAKSQAQAGEVLAALAIAQEYSGLDNEYIGANLKLEDMHESAYNEDYCQTVWDWSTQRLSHKPQ